MKKVILFIVEGTTDERALGGILNEIFKKDHKISFQILRGDITSDEKSNPGNIIKKIVKQVNAKCAVEGLWNKDILKVVHLVDIDGAYVTEDFIIEDNNVDHIKYTKEEIRTRYVDKTKDRNKRKSEILNLLVKQKFINRSIPYEVYYFSCNLEHVLHDIHDVPDKDKTIFAEEFSERFYKKTDEFIEFLHSKEFMVEGDYISTWEHIRKGKNSLHRHCNFHLFFDEYK